jgi:hypothetical protein
VCGAQGWGACEDEIVPRPEECDGADDDCDGSIDEEFPVESCGVGACAREVATCVDGRPVSCQPDTPKEEICNGLDDDCDGVVDDGFGMSTVTSCGIGACRRFVTSCVDGMPQECVPGAPAAELCNGIDDDCDGSTDEGLPAPQIDSAASNCADCITLYGDGFAPDAIVEVRRNLGSFDLLAVVANPAIASGSELTFTLATNYQRQLIRTSGLRVRVINDCQNVASPTVILQMPLDIVWSSSDPISGKYCVQIQEAADPNTWNDNYLCSDIDHGFSWSSARPIANSYCLQISEPSDPHTWDDNYLCNPLPNGKTWSYAGAISGRRCVQWTEPSDPDQWHDNFLCF